ncbi:ERMES complex subunit mmm1 [Sorochytrium milnesiophthora]
MNDETVQGMLAVVRAASSQATVHFVRGLLLGVLLTVLVAVLAIRLLFFHSTPSTYILPSLLGHVLDRRRVAPASRTGAVGSVSSASAGPNAFPPMPLPLPVLVSLHRQALELTDDLESSAWLNLLLAQIISHYRQDPEVIRYLAQTVIEPALNNIIPSVLGKVTMSHLSLGSQDQFPLLKRTRIKPSRAAPAPSRYNRSGRARLSSNLQASTEPWRAEVEFEFVSLSQYTSKRPATPSVASGSLGRASGARLRKASVNNASGAKPATPARSATPADLPASDATDEARAKPFLAIALDTQLVLNWPRPHFAALPIHLMVEIAEFKGTLAIEFVPPAQPGGSPSVSICILAGYTLVIHISSLIGSRTKLRDLPRIAELISHQLRQVITQKIVEPNVITIPLPSVPVAPTVFTDVTASATASAAATTDQGTTSAAAPVGVDPLGSTASTSQGRQSGRLSPSHEAGAAGDDEAEFGESDGDALDTSDQGDEQARGSLRARGDKLRKQRFGSWSKARRSSSRGGSLGSGHKRTLSKQLYGAEGLGIDLGGGQRSTNRHRSSSRMRADGSAARTPTPPNAYTRRGYDAIPDDDAMLMLHSSQSLFERSSSSQHGSRVPSPARSTALSSIAPPLSATTSIRPGVRQRDDY